jgi:hypothetical protein
MKKSQLIIFLSLLFVFVSGFVIWFSISETSRSQEIRGQAYGTNGGGGNNGGGGATCNQAPVNVQFRKYEQGTDKPWISGQDLQNLNLKITKDTPVEIDVNCFAKNGSAQLSGARINITRQYDDVVEVIPLQNPVVPSLSKFVLSKAGKYTFTCSDANNICKDSDSFTIQSDLPASCTYQQVQCVQAPCPPVLECPSTTPSPSTGPTCGNGKYAISDVNKDCKTDIQDYSLFLSDYRQQTGL